MENFEKYEKEVKLNIKFLQISPLVTIFNYMLIKHTYINTHLHTVHTHTTEYGITNDLFNFLSFNSSWKTYILVFWYGWMSIIFPNYCNTLYYLTPIQINRSLKIMIMLPGRDLSQDPPSSSWFLGSHLTRKRRIQARDKHV